MLQVVSSRFTIFYLLTRTVFLSIPLAIVFIPFYLIFFEDKLKYESYIFPILVIIAFISPLVYMILKNYSIVRIELYPHAIRFNNIIMMKGLQYKYSDIVKVQMISNRYMRDRFIPMNTIAREVASTPGFIIYFKDDFQIEITAETYSNTKEMLDCIQAMMNAKPSANLEIL
mgnify:CR=1 FL=1